MRQYEMFELCITAGGEIGEMSVEFELDGARTLQKCFYDGGGVYKARYLPERTGVCRWKTVGALSMSGQEECMPAEHGRHGRVKAVGTHFEYADGTYYYPFGTTVYALAHQSDELVRKTLSSLKNSPFNKVRFCVFPKHYDFNHNEPPFFAFERDVDGKWDVSKPCYAFWHRFEGIISALGDMGIECDVILFHPYDRWGFSRLSKQDSIAYLELLLRRLSAFPNVWWSMANEYDLMDNYTKDDFADFARYIRKNDNFGHLLSCHNCFDYFDFSQPEITHCSVQDIFVSEAVELKKKYNKPVVYDECCYEGNIEYGWGNISARELTDRFWTAVVNGGYCTHGETYLSDDEVLWWAKGGTLKGESPKRIAFLREISEALPSPIEYLEEGVGRLTEEMILGYKKNGIPKNLKTDFWVKGLTSLPDERIKGFILRSRGVCGHCGDDAFIWYYGRSCPAFCHILLPENSRYRVEVIDTWEMTRKTVLENVCGRLKIALSSKEGMAVLATKTDA